MPDDFKPKGFSSEKEKIFEALLKSKGIVKQESRYSAIPKREKCDKYELSFAQQRLWFLNQFDPESPSYNIPLVVDIKGPISQEGVTSSIQEIVKRHEILRTYFVEQDGEPFQVILDTVPVEVTVEDLPDTWTREELIAQKVVPATQKPFQLAQAPLIRAVLFKIKADESILAIMMHHIITDGWSLGILIKEFLACYEHYQNNQPLGLPELAVQYADYAVWQRKCFKEDALKNELDYWKAQLKDLPPFLELPADFSRPPIQTVNGAIEIFHLDRELITKLNELSRSEGVTLFMTLLAAFKVLLYRYTMQEDLVVGSPVAGRNHSNTDNLLGFFVNTLVLRTQLKGTMPFREFLNRVKETTLNGFMHQNIPFEKLVEELNVERNLSYSPLFQVMFVLQNAPVPELKLPGLNFNPISIDSSFAQYDLSVTLWEEKNELKGTFEYNTDLFLPETIGRIKGHFQRLLQGIIDDPGGAIASLPILSSRESQQLTTEWNATREDYPRELGVWQLFEAQAAQTPDQVAVISETRQLAYRELDQKSNQLAHWLAKQGVGPETIVAVGAGYSWEMMAGILGILKAGGAYVPLDPAYPGERLDFILRDTGSRHLLIERKMAARISVTGLHQIYLDDVWEEISGESTTKLDYSGNQSPAANPACVIYTSGSTGNPKGAIIEHRSIVNLITSFIRSYHPRVTDRILPLTSVGSASFVGEIFPLLCAGGSLILADKTSFLNFETLMALIAEKEVTMISTVPSLMARLNSEEGILPPKLRLLLSGGEALLPSDIHKLVNSLTIVNSYGLTETTICSTYRILDPTNYNAYPVVSIGVPVMNHSVYILDQHLNCLPVGCPGEIYIGGEGLARGYINDPQLTAERFIPNPFLPGTKMYRTGDISCWLPDGNIKFLGRIDSQVKIRGFRIETAEVENRLNQHPEILNSLVIVREDDPGDKRLVAYLILKERKSITNSEMRNWLIEKIPEPMIPSVFEVMEEFPLNANGKVDIKLLPQPARQRPNLDSTYELPKTELERQITAIWKEVLNIDQVGISDNFFDLGGHSLLLTRIHSKMKKLTNQEIQIIDFFKYPTINSLASYLSRENEPDLSIEQAKSRAGKQREIYKQKQQLRKQN